MIGHLCDHPEEWRDKRPVRVIDWRADGPGEGEFVSPVLFFCLTDLPT